MRNSTLGLCLALLLPATLSAQLSFTNASNLLSNVTNSGGCMGVVDMNGDGLDDIAKLHNSRFFMVDYQNPDGTFTLVDYGQVASENQWGMSIADMTNTGHKDLVVGGSYDGVHYLRIPSLGTSNLTDLDNGSMYMQCNNIADINNDGHLDFFACHDDAAPRQWLNDGDGGLSFANIIDYTTDPTSDMSGNYGSVWCDFDNDGDLDLYIAKCRQNVNNQSDPRRWNRLFVNDGNNAYSDQAEQHGIQVRNQSWTADFGDIDNDGDFDLVITNHDATIQLFENNGTGQFTEITAGSGLEITGFFLQSKFVDFDNDGFVDLLLAGGIERYFKNDGDHTFTQVNELFPSNKAMHSFATGDLNNDGFQDVWANYGSGYVSPDPVNPDRLWLNEGNDNHWFSVRLEGTVSNRDAVGARVTIIGPWGTQIREVRSGESYGMVTSFACHFGIGEQTTVPTVIVRWPSGLEETYTDLDADQTITLIEGLCIAPVALIEPSAAPALCGNGDSVDLSANPGYTYLWSNGATTQTISVTEPGNYTVAIDDGSGCSGNAALFVAQIPVEVPTITASSSTMFCAGEEVMLMAPTSTEYTWSTGETGQSITVEDAGSYTVTTMGACGAATSEAVEVLVYSTPMPVADDVVIPAPAVATLIAEGEDLMWYDVPTGGAPIATGPTFETPVIANTTSFWVTETMLHNGGTFYGARTDNDDVGGYHNNGNFYLLFTATESFIIRSVKVYASGAGNRNIGLASIGTGTIAQGTFAIPDGEQRVDLDFVVPGPGEYGLRITSGNPSLWRDNQGSVQNYPYALGSYGEITGTNASNGGSFYYFFYDWEVEKVGVSCESDREEVVVYVGNVGLNETGSLDPISIWPNPVSDQLTIAYGELSGPVTMDIFDITGRLLIAQQADARAHGGSQQLDVRSLAAGDYVVRVGHAQGTSVHRFMVH